MQINGTYAISFNTPFGRFDGKIELVESGGKVCGKLLDGKSDTAFEGEITGEDKFKFTVQIPTPIGKVNSVVEGGVDAEKLSARASIPFGSVDIEGRRVS